MFAGLARLAARAGVTAPTSSLPGALPLAARGRDRLPVRATGAAFAAALRPASSSGPRLDERQRAVDFCLNAGYEPAIAEGIVDTLLAPGSGITKSAVYGMVQAMGGRMEVDEDNGLDAMAKAIENELARTAGKALINFTVHGPRGATPFGVKGFEGQSLKQVVEHGDEAGAAVLGEYIECACDGLMACSTCHVVVDPAWFDRVGHPDVHELDMLDLAYEPTDTSRLGCQIVLSKALDGMVITVPDGANNLFDHIPFDD